MNRTPLQLAAMAIIVSASIMGLIHAPKISAWERANGFPAGQMCNSVFTFYKNTCK